MANALAGGRRSAAPAITAPAPSAPAFAPPAPTYAPPAAAPAFAAPTAAPAFAAPAAGRAYPAPVHTDNGAGPPSNWPVLPSRRPVEPAQQPARQPAQPLATQAAPAPPPALPAALPAQASPADATVTGEMAVHPSFLGQSTSDNDRWAGLFPDPADRLPARQADPNDTAELPIFREIQATWFRSLGHTATGGWPLVEPSPAAAAAVGHGGQTVGHGGPAVGHGGPDNGAASSRPAAGRAEPARAAAAPVSADDQDPDEMWRTRADVGWRAAAVASNPPVKDRTRSGLPKRQPRAQLVPGGVSGRPPTRSARDPEETRGRLAAYHRGIQRGRASTADSSNPTEGNTR